MFKGNKKTYKIIGICTAGVHNDNVKDAAMSICRSASSMDYNVLLFNSFSDLYRDNDFIKGEASIFKLVNPKLLDALVILPESIKNDRVVDEIISYVRAYGVPVISVDKVIEGCCNIVFNYVDTFERIVRHVVEDHGCKRVNFIAGFKGNDFSEQRVECYKNVLAENGIEFEEGRLGYGDFWETPTKKVVESFLESDLPFPEAIICANDTMAITACQILTEKGYSVPKDVIVTGFDGIELEKYNSPRLTTAAADIQNLGQVTMDAIERIISGGKPEDPIEIPYQIRISQSCGCETIDTKSVTGKIMEMYQIINNSYGHETFMFSYLSKTVGCKSFSELAEVIAHFSDQYTWCCVNTDFLDVSLCKERYNQCFTSKMKMLVRCEGDEYDTNVTFPTETLLPNLEDVLEKHRYIMFSPMHFQKEIIGYIAVSINTVNFSFQNTRRFLSNTNQIMESFKSRRSLERANAELAQMHMRDPMTGIYNRRGFYSGAVKLIRKAVRANKQMVIFSIDMDNLKYINDTFGHNEGDKAIKAISNVLVKCSDNGEICSRFGGDEFVVLSVADSSKEYSEDFIQRINSGLVDYNKKSKLPYDVKISCGSASKYLRSVEELDDFLKIADSKMYEQKRQHKSGATYSQ